MNDFEQYLKINELNKDNFFKVMESYLLHELFVIIFNNLEKNDNKIILKRKLLLCNDSCHKNLIVKHYIRSIIELQVTEKQEKYLINAVYAYIRKSSFRESISIEFKKDIYNNQRRKCNICNKTFAIEAMEPDHKLAFNFVGDELSDNIQLICKRCNRLKSKGYNYILTKFLLKNNNFN